MCLLIVKEKGIHKVPSDHLMNGWNANSDGVGVAWTKGDGFVSFKKFLEYSDFKKFCKTAEFTGKEKDYAMMYHFRWATHGSVKLQNVHPFVLSSSPHDILKTEGKARSVVGHNGIISNVWADLHTDFSDTMVFVRDILASKAIRENMEDDAVQELLENFIYWSKIAILDGTAKFTFINRHCGIKEKTGIWYSNSWYKSFNNYRPLSLPPSIQQYSQDAYYEELQTKIDREESLYDKEYKKALDDLEFGKNKPFESQNARRDALLNNRTCDYCHCTVTELKSDWYGSKVCTECWNSYFVT